jgi:hypothetical protein
MLPSITGLALRRLLGGSGRREAFKEYPRSRSADSSSNEAELVALCATVLVALRRQASFREGDFVVAKSDCLYAVEHLKNKTGGATEAERRMVAKVHAALQVHGLRF